MKLFSKDGQALVNVTSLDIEGDDLVMQAKLMNAYTTTIYLTPYELRSATKLLKKSMISHVLKMFRMGKNAQPKEENKPTFTA